MNIDLHLNQRRNIFGQNVSSAFSHKTKCVELAPERGQSCDGDILSHYHEMIVHWDNKFSRLGSHWFLDGKLDCKWNLISNEVLGSLAAHQIK